MRQALLLFMLVPLLAWTQPVKLPRSYSCELPPPDSVDVTGDGIADFVVRGMLGVSTCDIPVSYGGCEVGGWALPGTQLLGRLHPMGGRDVQGFARGDTIPALDEGIRDDLRIPRYAFMDGGLRALTWSYGRNGTTPPQLAPMADRVFVFATRMGDRMVHGTFTLDFLKEQRTVRIQPGTLPVGDKPVIVP